MDALEYILFWAQIMAVQVPFLEGDIECIEKIQHQAVKFSTEWANLNFYVCVYVCVCVCTCVCVYVCVCVCVRARAFAFSSAATPM